MYVGQKLKGNATHRCAAVQLQRDQIENGEDNTRGTTENIEQDFSDRKKVHIFAPQTLPRLDRFELWEQHVKHVIIEM